MDVSILQSSKVKWDKVDKEACSQAVAQKLTALKTNPFSLGVIDCEIRKLNDSLVSTAEILAPQKVRRHRKARLKVYSPEIKQAIRGKKELSFLAVEERQ